MTGTLKITDNLKRRRDDDICIYVQHIRSIRVRNTLSMHIVTITICCIVIKLRAVQHQHRCVRAANFSDGHTSYHVSNTFLRAHFDIVPPS